MKTGAVVIMNVNMRCTFCSSTQVIDIMVANCEISDVKRYGFYYAYGYLEVSP